MSSLHEWRPNLRLQPSLLLLMWIASIHVVLTLLLLWASFPALWQWLLVGLVCSNGLFCIWRYGLGKGRNAVMRVIWQSDGWLLETREGLSGPYALSESSWLGRNLLLLQFYRPGSRLKWPLVIPVCRDALDSKQFRYLQIFLRWQRPPLINPALFPEADV